MTSAAWIILAVLARCERERRLVRRRYPTAPEAQARRWAVHAARAGALC